MLEAVSRQKKLSSYKVFGERYNTVVIFRFGSNGNTETEKEVYERYSGTFRRKTQSQQRRDRRRAEQRKTSKQQETNITRQYEASDNYLQETVVEFDSLCENNDSFITPVNYDTRPTLPVLQCVDPVSDADQQLGGARADRDTTNDSGFVNLESSADHVACEEENVSSFLCMSDFVSITDFYPSATECSSSSACAESGSLSADDNNDSLSSSETLITADGEAVYRINDQHYVGVSTMQRFDEDVTADPGLEKNFFDDSRNFGFIKMVTKVSNDSMELLCESDDLLFLLGVDEETNSISAQFHFFVKKEPSKRRPLERNILLMVSRLTPTNDSDNLRYDAEHLLKATLDEIRILLREC